MKIATLSSKKLGDVYEGSLKNNYLYQGAYNELDDDIGWHDFFLRNYDAQIGRWVQQDPYQQFASPYLGMGNDPVNGVDPSGGIYIAPLKIVQAAGGAATTAKVLQAAGQAGNAISLLNKAANIGLKVFQVGNALNNVFNTPNAGGRYYYTPGGQKFYAPSDEVELFDGKEQKLGDKSIFPMKGTLKAFTIRGDDVEDGAVRFVAKFNPKTGEFKEYVWDKHLNSTYQDFENAFVKDLIEQIDHEDDPLYQHYNSKEEARKSLINLFLFGLLPNPILKTTTGVINATKGGGSWVYGAFKTEAKWAGQLSKRGWTAEQITEAVTKGKSFDAVNKVNKANSATRYVHPTTGQSVVIDNVTKELLHVGGPGFKY